MPTWSEILHELNESRIEGGAPQFDAVRRRYLTTLAQRTKRDTILYASKWTQHDPNVSPDLVSIVDEDIQGIMEVIYGLKGPNLDLILHSPGGSLEAAEALVQYLRSKFSHIRVIVPQMAMSAATMIACAGDEVVLGKHSFLGPIDPQIILNTPLGQRMVPAQAVLDQFEQAKRECADPAKLAAWLPMLNQYGPDLLVQCEHANELSKSLVQRWLETYMFKRQRNKKKAKEIADWLCDHAHFKTHGRHIPRQEVESRGLRISHLEKDQTEQDLVLSVFHATTHTFNGTAAVKVIENDMGRAFIKQMRAVMVQVPPGQPQQGLPQTILPQKQPMPADPGSNPENRKKKRSDRSG